MISVVIGGGPAGYVSAIKAAQLGGKVALVEKSELGGTCLNRGCIPTKTYLHNAEIIENIGHAANRGIVIENPNFTVDMDKVLETKNKVVNTLVGGVAGLFVATEWMFIKESVPSPKIRMSWSMVLNCLKRRKSSLPVVQKLARLTFLVWNHPLS